MKHITSHLRQYPFICFFIFTLTFPSAVALALDTPKVEQPLVKPPAVNESDEALKKLIEGNKRFISGRHLQATDQKQHPSAIVVACSDSTAAPEIIFDQGLNDIFVVRAAGNVLDPVSVGSIEYAAKQLHAPLLIILGHDRCDVVKTVLEATEASQGNVMAVFRKIVPAARKATESGGSKEEILNKAIRENILVQQRYLLRKSPVVNNLITSQALKVVTAIYHDDTGEVELFDGKAGK